MTTSSADLGGLNLPELTALLHSVADEIELRMMQQAGENACVCCDKPVPEGLQVCPVCSGKYVEN